MSESPLGLWSCTNSEYHACHEAIGHSMIDCFRDSVLDYEARYVSGTTPPDEPTDAMRLGTALHALVLEPENFEDLIAVGPDCDRRSNANKDRWAEFEAAHPSHTILKPEQLVQVQQMRDSLRHNPFAAQLLAGAGRREQAIRWRDAPTELTLKARFDLVLDARIIVDVKTTSSLAGWRWRNTVNDRGYPRQAAHYIEGYRVTWACPGQGQHLHMVFTSEPPYEVAVFTLDADALMLGAQQNRKALDELAACYASGEWVSRHAGKIVSVSLPKYCFYDEENQ